MAEVGAILRSMLTEFRRRRVFRAAGIYVVAGAGLIEGADTILPLLGLPEDAARAVLALVAAGFPVALWLAWAYDLVPGGVEADRSSGDGARDLGVGTVALLATATILGLALPIFILLDLRAGPVEASAVAEAPPDPSTVTVVRFANLSSDAENEYFSLGITEQIVSRLVSLGGMRVVSRVAEPRPDAPSAEGAWLLDGSVQRAQDRVRIAVKLLDRSGVVVWTRDFDRDLTVADIFQVQTEVALAVARELRAEIVADTVVGAPTGDFDAYDHYLRGNYYLGLRTPASVQRAISEYRAASGLDPEFADAITREAYAYGLFVDWGWSYPGSEADELIGRALDLSDRALALDSASAEAWLTRGYLLVVRDPHGLDGAVPALERALALGPNNAEIHHQLGQSLMILGRWDEAMAAYRRAVGLEPTRAMTLVPMSAIAYRQGDPAAARRWADSAVAVGAEVPYAWVVRARLRNETGDPDGALRDAEMALSIDRSQSVPALAMSSAALYQLGRHAEAGRQLELALRGMVDPDAPSPTEALYLAGALVTMERREQALALLERVRPRGASLWFSLRSPAFDPVRDHPRFRALEVDAAPG